MQMETDEIEIEVENKPFTGSLTVSVEADSPSDVLTVLAQLQQQVEGMGPGIHSAGTHALTGVATTDGSADTYAGSEGGNTELSHAPDTSEGDPDEYSDDDAGADNVYEDHEDAESEGPGSVGGVEGRRYRIPDVDVPIVSRDDGIVAVGRADGKAHLIEPGNKAYWSLWHFAYYEAETGEPASNTDLESHFPHMGNPDSVTPHLRRASFIRPVGNTDGEDPLYGAEYTMTDVGTAYLHQHGEPEGYPLP